jgi:hypothetical protein
LLADQSLGFLDGELHALTENRSSALAHPTVTNGEYTVAAGGAGDFAWRSAHCYNIIQGCANLQPNVTFDRIATDVTGRSNYAGPIWRAAPRPSDIVGTVTLAKAAQMPHGNTIMTAKLLFAVMPSFRPFVHPDGPQLEGGGAVSINCAYDRTNANGVVRRTTKTLGSDSKSYQYASTSWQTDSVSVVTSPLDLQTACVALGPNAELQLQVRLSYSTALQFDAVEFSSSQIVH